MKTTEQMMPVKPARKPPRRRHLIEIDFSFDWALVGVVAFFLIGVAAHSLSSWSSWALPVVLCGVAVLGLVGVVVHRW